MRCPPQFSFEPEHLLCYRRGPDFAWFDMTIDPVTVRRIARLARLSIDASDLSRVTDELVRVLDLAGQLAAASLADVEPMAHPQAQALAWRDDAVTAGDNAGALLALAPEARGGLYLVPKVIE